MKLRDRKRTNKGNDVSSEVESAPENQDSSPSLKKQKPTRDPSRNDDVNTVVDGDRRTKRPKTRERQQQPIKPVAKKQPIDGGIFESPEAYFESIQDHDKRATIQELHKMVQTLAPELAVSMDFKNTLSFGKYHYKYKSGREGDWYKIGITSNKMISMHFCGLDVKGGGYLLQAFEDKLAKSKKVKYGKSCVRFNSLDELNIDVLKDLIQRTAKAPTMQ